ncbi:ABC transporter permease [Microvirga sp. KLBC 81]|uniref:ABC transporter permease n=1 Tax=Microvirga sp. KLBC 81 TaxID=1862707 RepID=UPI000D515186|nr:ABC transporter permease [Microvirga sp. KLBC 81]PVE21754.1 ABC transporter permease [Microvirga sp. KLBC 81]
MSRNGPLALAFHAIFVIFILAPIVVVCAVAFTPEGYLSLPTKGFSLRWFKAIWNYPEFLRAFRDSLWLAALSSTIAIGLAVPAALAIARYRFLGREAITALFLSPLMIPHVVLGIAFLRFFSQIGLSGSFLGLILSHIIVVLPFALRLVLAASYGIDQRIEHAAISLGANSFVTFRRVTLPLIMPGVVSGWVLAFINSFDEVTMTVFIASPSTTTLPVRLFLYIQDNIDPLVSSVSASLILMTAVVMIVLDRLFGLDRLFLGSAKS